MDITKLEEAIATLSQRVEALASQKETRNEEPKAERKFNLGRMVKGIHTGKWDGADYEKALIQESVEADGGYLVPEEVNTTVLPKIYGRSVLGNLPITRVPTRTGHGRLTRQTTGATVVWTPEAQEGTESDIKFDTLAYDLKKVVCFVPVTKEMLEDSPEAVDALVRADIQKAMSKELDRVAFYGAGGNEPEGLASKAITTISAGGPLSYDKLVDLESAVREAEFSVEAYAQSEKRRTAMRKIKDNDGRPILDTDPTKSGASTLFGAPMFASTGIEDADTWAGEWSHLMEIVKSGAEGLVFSTSEHVYFKKQIVLIAASLRRDFQTARPAAFARLTA